MMRQNLPLPRPFAVLFDWHATLVDTHNAMYLAVDDMLARLAVLGLDERLIDAGESKTPEDARLLEYVRRHHRLHPKVVAARKISRTDIFELLFGDNDEAKAEAHLAFDAAYRTHIEDVFPMEPDVREQLLRIRSLGLPIGVISNRRREFLERELAMLENGGWAALFDVTVCGTDVARRKPAPDPVLHALERLGLPADEHVWYVGDSTTDVISARRAGVTPVFYNGAGWSRAWIEKIFPGSRRYPHQPAAVAGSIREVADRVVESVGGRRDRG